MDQILIYTTIGYNLEYLELFKLFCESLCFTTANNKNLLIISDARFRSQVEEIVSKYAMINFYIMDTPDSKSPEEASKHKTRVFEFKEIYRFRVCLYVDVDCVFLKDIYSLFKNSVCDGKLYVYAESENTKDHLLRWFSLTKKNGENFYTSGDIELFQKRNIRPFNAGLFLFRISPLIEKAFSHLNVFMNTFDGIGFYEQSYMNTFFNLNGMSDFSYFKDTIAMQSTHLIPKEIISSRPLSQPGKLISSQHALLHFNATLPGDANTKRKGMKNYFQLVKESKRCEVTVFESREQMIKQIIPENVSIVEVGVFEGEFASRLVELNPSHLFLVDCWEKGPVVSGDADGNNVKTIKNGEELFYSVSNKFKFNPNVSIHKEYSFTYLQKIADSSVDVIYIDGDHSYEGVKKDLELAIKKVKKYGLIMGHDYEMNMSKAKQSYNFGVKKAVDEFCLKYNVSLYAKGNDGCVSFAIINTYEPPTVPTERFQIIAVCNSEERKKMLLEQYSYFFKNKKMIFVDTYNPDEYFPKEIDSERKKVLGYGRNHIKALHIASLEKTIPFSLIIDESVSFHLTDTNNLLDELIENWDNYVGTDKIVSLGWQPLHNYSHYLTLKHEKEFAFNKSYRFFNNFWAVGFQAYMVRNKDIGAYVDSLLQPTFDQLKIKISDKKCLYIDSSIDPGLIDTIIPRLLGQRIVFPPLAIQLESLHNSKLWERYFDGNTQRRNEYLNQKNDSISSEYFKRFPELENFKRFKQVIIWGYPLYSHTHSYIHNAWFRMFKALDISVYWFWDKDYPKEFDYNNSCFITEGWVDKNIPLLSTCTYFVHIAQNPQKYIKSGARLIEIRYNVDSIDDYNYKYTLPTDAFKLSNDTLYEIVKDDSVVAEKRGRAIENLRYEVVYMYWAADLLPHEFDYADAKIVHKQIFNHVGSLEKGHPLREFQDELKKENIKFVHYDPWTNPVSYEFNMKLMKESFCCPDFRNYSGVDCNRLGYIADRVFKAISYGHTGITNSPRMKTLLKDHVEYIDTIQQIIPTVKRREHDHEWRMKCMKYVSENHTYLNRASDLAKAISFKKQSLKNEVVCIT